MRQYAPEPYILFDLVQRLDYKPGWYFGLGDLERDHESAHSGSAGGLTFQVTSTTPDAYHPERQRSVVHYFPVPAATYDEQSWQRWLLDCLIKVETHEACEFFQLREPDNRPFAPNHGPGRDPYTIFQYATDVDRRTSFRGVVKDA